jgi:ABC-2 type transport system ATP-binding protein
MIHVEKLTKYFNYVCAVDSISFHVRKGEILGLLGPNGAGKTTCLRMLTGFLKPTSGSIRIKDFSIESDVLRVKKLMGYLPESAPLYRDMLVYDYLMYVAGVRKIEAGKKDSRIGSLADRCGLCSVMHKPIGELSKGFKQRVGLAHAMINDPEILVLDEPTSGLDPNQIVEIRDIIRQIGKEKTIILSTHILSEAEAACDRVMIIHRGRIAADDRTENLKVDSARETIVKMTLRNVDPVDAEQLLGTLPGVSSVKIKKGLKQELLITLTGSDETDIRESAYQAVKQTDWLLIELFQEKQTLENIFRQITLES